MRGKDQVDVVVIGAGAAGLMAAIFAARGGASVVVLEKAPEPARKLAITGGGRCNITNDLGRKDIRAFAAVYGDAEPYLHSVFARFSVDDTFRFFEDLGLPLVVEARGRVFPQSQKATDVVRVLLAEAKRLGVRLYDRCAAFDWLFDSKAQVVGVKAHCITLQAKHIILAAGGLSGGKELGSKDGFRLLEKLGHTVVPPSPDLTPLQVKEKELHTLAGVTLSFMQLRFLQHGKAFFKKTGKLLFTHFGISGPLVINASHTVKMHLAKGPVIASVDLFPDTDLGSLDRRFLKLAEKSPRRHLVNTLSELVPRQLAGVILNQLRIAHEVPARQLPKEARKKLIATLKDFRFTIAGLMGQQWAIVADGGVVLDEIDTKTMRSRKHPSVQVVGDLLHINRPSGGYSLQLCWSTGAIAGAAAAGKTPHELLTKAALPHQS